MIHSTINNMKQIETNNKVGQRRNQTSLNPWNDGKIGTITDIKENWYSYPVTKYTLYLNSPDQNKT